LGGKGGLSLVSGSNCCAREQVHLFLRKADGTFADRRDLTFELPGHDDFLNVLRRDVSRPHLLDWDRDGHTDLVVGYPGDWTLYIGRGPLADKTEVKVKPFAVLQIPNASPMHFGFADWDGDGNVDLFAAVRHGDEKASYGIYWYRNTCSKREPKFAAPKRLFTIPAPWELAAISVVDWDQDGRLDIVVSATRDSKAEGGAASQLWLYRRKG
jgi:hypothetical protein